MIPEYSTVTFTDVWDNIDDFKFDLANSPFGGCIHQGETAGGVTYPDNVALVFYLLYARYGNNPIANRDINQWKFKVFSVMFQYGPTWEKELSIQKEVRALNIEDLRKGTTNIINNAVNPSTTPSTQDTNELPYVTQQNVSKNTRSIADGYALLLSLLKDDVTEVFLKRFQKLFLTIVQPELPLWYKDYSED